MNCFVTRNHQISMNRQIFILLALLSSLCFSQPEGTAPNNPDSLAAALYAEGNYWKLMEISRQFSADSLSAKFCFHLGMSYAALSEPQRAQEFLKRAIALDSAKLQYRYQYARVLSQSGLYPDAVRELNRCIAMDSSYIPARFQLGLTYAAQKTEPEQEMSVFSWLIDRNPKDFLSLYYMSEALKRSGKPDSAAQYLLRSLSANPRYVPTLIAISNFLNSKKMYVDALPYYLRADSIRGGNKDLVFQIGECYRKLGDLPKAKIFFQRAIALDS
jgi:tetratricopeptide (TPR) repeat protein